MIGSYGDDQLHATDASNQNAMLNDDGVAAATGEERDWLNGGSGDDLLVGSSGQNTLTGGGGKDTIIAGAGDDYIMGILIGRLNHLIGPQLRTQILESQHLNLFMA